MSEKLRLALLDMNNGVPNQGMRCLRDIVGRYEDELDWQEFEVRQQGQLPDTSFDIYISSGGPGSPLDGGTWKKQFFDLIDALWKNNQDPSLSKKYFFFICHSFQMACEHFELGTIAPRKTTSFGVYPVHKTAKGRKDRLLNDLADPYHVVDSRDWQLIQPRLKVFAEWGATILSLEKIRTHVELERAIMAVRFSDEFVGTQFHPEADPVGMKTHFEQEENRQKVIKNFGLEKYEDMMDQLEDPEKITLTHNKILPHFIESSIQKLHEANTLIA